MEKKTKSGQSSTKRKSTKREKSDPTMEQGLRELFIDELKDIYWAKKALTKALPKMIKKSTSKELISTIEEHLEVTQQQVTRIEQVFAAIGTKAQAKKCEAMEGLIKEAEEIMESADAGLVRDAGIISAGRKVEHYEIASYSALCDFARKLGQEQAASLLDETLNEEKEADGKLSEVSNSLIMNTKEQEVEELEAVHS